MELSVSEETHIQKNRQVLDETYVRLPGLVLLGHTLSREAYVPLSLHIHPGCIEVVMLLKGEESYFVGDHPYFLRGGDVFVSHVDEPHGSGKPYQGVNELIWFQLKLDAPKLLLLDAEAADLLRAQLRDLPHQYKAAPELPQLARDTFQAFLRQDGLMNCLGLFITLLSRLLIREPPLKDAHPEIQSALRYISENIHSPITMDQLCEASHLSQSYLKSLFKSETGQTPRDYINHQKILESKKLLSSGLSVMETAMRLGFNSSDYFAVVFRRYAAMSPTEFMRSRRRDI